MNFLYQTKLEECYASLKNSIIAGQLPLYSDLPYLKLHVGEIPIDEIYQEWLSIKHTMIPHRDYENNQGWYSVCLHGIDMHSTNTWKVLKYESRPHHDWTEIAKDCPVTVDWIKKNLPMDRYDRIRFMLLEPGGYISLHSDYPQKKLAPINISITNPKGCNFIWEDWGQHPWEPGQAYIMNVHYAHQVVNTSQEIRLHIIIDGHKLDSQLLLESLQHAM